MKFIINVIFLAVLFLFFQNNLNLQELNVPELDFSKFSSLFKTTPSCSDSVVKNTIKDLILNESKKKLGFMSNIGGFVMPEQSHNVKKGMNMIDNELSKSSFKLSNIRIKKEEKRIKKISCKADIEVNGYNQPIDYTAQYTEDGDRKSVV